MRRLRVTSPLRLSVAAALLALGLGSAAAEPSIGAPAPTLVVTTIGGETVDLEKLRGKVVLVNFWASWCAPCRKEMPRLDSFYRSHKDRGLEIVGISIDAPRDYAKARKMMSRFTYPAAFAKDNNLTAFEAPASVPVTYIIDAQGIVRDKFIDVYDKLLNDVVVPLLIE